MNLILMSSPTDHPLPKPTSLCILTAVNSPLQLGACHQRIESLLTQFTVRNGPTTRQPQYPGSLLPTFPTLLSISLNFPFWTRPVSTRGSPTPAHGQGHAHASASVTAPPGIGWSVMAPGVAPELPRMSHEELGRIQVFPSFNLSRSLYSF